MTEIAVTSPVAERTRRVGRSFDGALLLSGATVGSGVLAYAYHVLAARVLGPEAYGLVAVLWAALFLLVVVLFRPLEQTTSRALADRLARGHEVRSVLRSMVRIYLVLTLAILAAGALGWSVVRDELFLGDATFVYALVAGLAAYGIAYLLRGVCAGSGWFGGYALLLVADGGVRLLVAAPLIVVASKSLAATAAVAAAIGSVVLPVAVGRRRIAALVARGPGTPFATADAVAFAWPAGVIATADQVLVNGGPLLVMLQGGSDASTVAALVFAATMLVRIPVFIFQGLATSLLPNLTTLHATREPKLFQRAVLRISGILAAFTAALVACAVLAGPETMRFVYGADYVAGRLELTLLALGVGGYMATSAFSQALLALDRGRIAAVGWSVAALLFLVLYFAIPGAPLLQVAGAFAVATTAGIVFLALALSRGMRRR